MQFADLRPLNFEQQQINSMPKVHCETINLLNRIRLYELLFCCTDENITTKARKGLLGLKVLEWLRVHRDGWGSRTASGGVEESSYPFPQVQSRKREVEADEVFPSKPARNDIFLKQTCTA